MFLVCSSIVPMATFFRRVRERERERESVHANVLCYSWMRERAGDSSTKERWLVLPSTVITCTNRRQEEEEKADHLLTQRDGMIVNCIVTRQSHWQHLDTESWLLPNKALPQLSAPHILAPQTSRTSIFLDLVSAQTS